MGIKPTHCSTKYEKRLKSEGFKLVGGVDEVGRGALAGPVVAACVILGDGFKAKGIDDSKKLTPEARREFYLRIIGEAISVGVGMCAPDEIDRLNILGATLEAMRIAYFKCSPQPDVILVDGNQPFAAPVKVIPVVGGDAQCVCIAAASIVAKVVRDSIMECLGKNIDGYGFENHKGYGTSEHLKSIYSMGPSRVHRMSFSPLCDLEQGTLFKREEVGFF